MTASTPKGERRRHALIEAAAGLLDEGGFDAVGHRAVAERAGLPLAATTYYFRSLDELVAAAVEHHARAELGRGWARLAELAVQPQDDESAVELVLDALIGPATAGAEQVVLRYERFVVAARRPWLGPVMRELRTELDALLMGALSQAGHPVEADELERLVAVVDGAVVNALIEAAPDPRAAGRRMLLRSL
ncbi:MAG: TetR family transcriptional regulator [Pseudonocardiaceae bacterium]|nr:TetR family transcriptional regulator [Pseudonocardiaceae bacterium]